MVHENEGRIDFSDQYAVMIEAGKLIAYRLDALSILCQKNLFGYDFSKLFHFTGWHWLFFVEPSVHKVIKELLVTSRSIWIFSEMLPDHGYDFPKATHLEMFHGFWLLKFLGIAILLGGVLGCYEQYVPCQDIPPSCIPSNLSLAFVIGI